MCQKCNVHDMNQVPSSSEVTIMNKDGDEKEGTSLHQIRIHFVEKIREKYNCGAKAALLHVNRWMQ